MKKVIYYDSRIPSKNLIRIVSNQELYLDRIELEIEEGEDIEVKLREILGGKNANIDN